MLRIKLILARLKVIGPHLPDEPLEGHDIAGHLVLVPVAHSTDATAKGDGHGAPEVPQRLDERPVGVIGHIVGVVNDKVDGFGSIDIVVSIVAALEVCDGVGAIFCIRRNSGGRILGRHPARMFARQKEETG